MAPPALAPNAWDPAQRKFWDRLGVNAGDFCRALYSGYQGNQNGGAIVRRFATQRAVRWSPQTAHLTALSRLSCPAEASGQAARSLAIAEFRRSDVRTPNVGHARR
jgi:hypothetical protein